MNPARFKSARRRNVTLALAVLAILHFGLSTLLWGLMFCVGVRQEWPLGPIVVGAIPALLLLMWFGITARAALRRFRLAALLLVFGLVASAGLFAYDASIRNYQLHAESYQGGRGRTFLYNTWWWYNESWFRR